MRISRAVGLLIVVIAVFAGGWGLGTHGNGPTAADARDPFNPPRVQLADFKCYQILGGGNPPHRIGQLETQFGIEQNVAVNEAELLCTVATKANVVPTPNAVPNNADHLKCYNIPGTNKDAPNVRVHTEGQFGPEDFEVGPPKLICVPTTKTVLPTPTPSR
jgi:hypothetical protein